MHIVIMGCGRVGSSLAHNLARLDHSIAVIDQDPLAFRRLGESFPGRQVVGIGFDQETLIKAGINEAGAFAAVSSGDNSNIIAARVARETFNVQKVVARIYDPKRAEVYERLGIPTVATVPWTSSRLLKALLGEATSQSWRDPSGAVALVHVIPHEGWVGHPVTELEKASGGRVGLINRFGIGELPHAESVVQSGDTLQVFVTDDLADRLRGVVGQAPQGAN